MPSVRKNVKDLTPHEKRKFIDALKALKTRVRTLPNGASTGTLIFDEYPIIHRAIMMLYLRDGSTQPIGHRSSSFLPWHRAFMKAIEEELQTVDHEVTLPYWDWTDPESTRAVFSADFIGAAGSGPVTGHLQNWHLAMENARPLSRDVGDFHELANETAGANDLIRRNNDNFTRFSRDLESFHDFVHVWVGGTMGSVATAANDPVFFLHHCNTDRLWALWQDYGHPRHFESFYSVQAGYNVSGSRLDDPLFPWDGGKAHLEADALRVRVAHRLNGPIITNGSQLDYRNLRFSYDHFVGKLEVGKAVESRISRLSSNLYSFEVTGAHSGQSFTFQTEGTTDVEMELYGPALCDNCFGERRAYDDNSGTGGLNARISLTLNSGHYWVIVRLSDPASRVVNGAYSISVASKAETQPSPDGSKLRGQELIINQDFRASISAHGEIDWYHFRVPDTGAAETPVVVETRGSLDTIIILYGDRPPRGVIAWDDDSGDALNAYIKRPLAAGVYHVAVRTATRQTGRYIISVRI